MKVLVCGGREYSNKGRVFEVMDFLLDRFGELTVIHGGCSRQITVGPETLTVGADHFAGVWAMERGCKAVVFPAEWRKYGNAAGPIRNREMLEVGEPSLVVAFPTPGARNAGTTDMIRQAQGMGVKVIKVE